MSKQNEYTISLTDLTAQATLLDRHVCGGAGRDSFSYEVDITTSSLDKDKFVINNEVIEELDELFAGRLYIASCEQLAGGIIRFFAKLTGTRLVRIRARVYNNTGFVEVVHVKGTELPEGPQAANKTQIAAETKVKATAVANGDDYVPRSAC